MLICIISSRFPDNFNIPCHIGNDLIFLIFHILFHGHNGHLNQILLFYGLIPREDILCRINFQYHHTYPCSLTTITPITTAPTKIFIEPPYLEGLIIERNDPQPKFDFMGELQNLYVQILLLQAIK